MHRKWCQIYALSVDIMVATLIAYLMLCWSWFRYFPAWKAQFGSILIASCCAENSLSRPDQDIDNPTAYSQTHKRTSEQIERTDRLWQPAATLLKAPLLVEETPKSNACVIDVLTVFDSEQEWRTQIVVGSTWTIPALGALYSLVIGSGRLADACPLSSRGGPSSWWSQEDWNCQGWHPEQKSGEETRTRQLWYVLLFFCYYVIFRFFFHVSFYDNIRFHVYSFLDVCLEELWLWTNNKRRIYIHCHFGCS